MFQIRIHGRAGQGAKTIAQFLAEAGLRSGKFVQAFPSFGPVRTGAVMNAFVRLSDKPINLHSEIREPDAVLVIDPLLIDTEKIEEGLKKNGLIIVNSTRPVEALKKRLFAKGGKRGLDPGVKVVCLPASEIALKLIKKDIPNTVLLGALVKLTKVVKLDDLIKVAESRFAKKFNPELVQANIQLIKKGFNFIPDDKKQQTKNIAGRDN